MPEGLQIAAAPPGPSVELDEIGRRLLQDRCLTERDLAYMGPRQRAMVLEALAAERARARA